MSGLPEIVGKDAISHWIKAIGWRTPASSAAAGETDSPQAEQTAQAPACGVFHMANLHGTGFAFALASQAQLGPAGERTKPPASSLGAYVQARLMIACDCLTFTEPFRGARSQSVIGSIRTVIVTCPGSGTAPRVHRVREPGPRSL